MPETFSHKETKDPKEKAPEKKGGFEEKRAEASAEAMSELADPYIPELKSSDFAEVLNSDVPTFIIISATYCKSCKKLYNSFIELKKDVDKGGVAFNIFVITDDTSPDASDLYKKLGIKRPTVLPVLLFKGKDSAGKFEDRTGTPDDKESLSNFLKKQAGIAVEKVARTEEDYLNMVREDPENAMKFLGDFIDSSYSEKILTAIAENTEKQGPVVALMFYEKFEKKPYAKKILELAARNSSTTDVLGALEFFEKYSGESYADEVLETAVRTAAKNKPMLAVWHLKKYFDKPYKDEVLDGIAKDEKASRKIFEGYAKWLSDGHGDKADLKVFAEKVSIYYPELVKEFTF